MLAFWLKTFDCARLYNRPGTQMGAAGTRLICPKCCDLERNAIVCIRARPETRYKSPGITLLSRLTCTCIDNAPSAGASWTYNKAREAVI